jgi:hypothetical protein
MLRRHNEISGTIGAQHLLLFQRRAIAYDERVWCQVSFPFSRRATRWEKVAGRPDEGLFRYRDSLKEALIRPSGTFSRPAGGRRILIFSGRGR